MNEEYREAIENLGWNISDYMGGEDMVELQKYSPAGEDFGICVRTWKLVEDIEKMAMEFNIDEHVKNWIIADIHGVRDVPRASVLVRDAEAIDDMLQKLYWAVKKTSYKINREGKYA